MDNESLRNGMSENTKALKKEALGTLAKFIMDIPKADYSKLISQDINIKKVKRNVNSAMKLADKREKQSAKTKRKLKIAGNRSYVK